MLDTIRTILSGLWGDAISALVGMGIGATGAALRKEIKLELAYVRGELSERAPGRWAGAAVYLVRQFFRVVGHNPAKALPPEQWSGLTRNHFQSALQARNVADLATRLKKIVESRQTRVMPLFIETDSPRTVRLALQRVAVECREPKRQVFHFDFGAVPPQAMARRFLISLATFSGAVLDEGQEQSLKGIEKRFDVQGFSIFMYARLARRFFVFWRRPQRLVILIEPERLFSREGETDDERAAVECARVALSALGHIGGIPLIVLRDSDAKKTDITRFRRYGRRKNHVSVRGSSKRDRAFIENRFNLEPETLQLDDDWSIDHLTLLLSALERDKLDRLTETLDEAKGQAVEHRGKWLAGFALKVLARAAIKEGSPFRGTRDFVAVRTILEQHLFVLTLLSAPTPSSVIRALWQDIALFPGDYDREGLFDPTVGEPWLLREAVALGVVHVVEPDDESMAHVLYQVEPTVARVLASRGGTGQEEFVKRAEARAHAALLGLLPPGITHVSRYLSLGDFQPTGELAGFWDGTDYIVPLPPEVCRVVAGISVARQPVTAKAIKYIWRYRSGESSTEALLLLGPTAIDQWDRTARLRVHIASREGSANAVARSLEPYAASVFHFEGDAYRCGPGGFVQCLVVLKTRKELLTVTTLPKWVKDALSGDTQEVPVQTIERAISETLRQGIDDMAVVSLTVCTSHSVVDELRSSEALAWVPSVKPLPPRAYGSASAFGLVIGRTELDALASLANVGRDELVLRGFYSSTSLQIFFAVTRLDLERDVRAVVTPNASRSGDDSASVRDFLELLEREQVNLRSLRRGPGGGFWADIEFPRIYQSQREFDMRTQRQFRAHLVRDLKSKLAARNCDLMPVGGVPETFFEEHPKEPGWPNANLVKQASRKFGENTHPLAPGAYDLVNSPDMFHRYMRKHLFIPDADAGVVCLARYLLRDTKDPRILEIGSGTGALTEKLLGAGFRRVDVVEPDPKLADYWRARRQWLGLSQHGELVVNELEAFARTSPEPYDLLVSQGVHHHIAPTTELDGETEDSDYRLTFLKICRSLVRQTGHYVVSDEFVRDYGGDPGRRVSHIDHWYRQVIANALADGFPELAALEYGYWLSDKTGTAEMKESTELFQTRLARDAQPPFRITSSIQFGLNDQYGGGFAVLVLEPQ